MTLQSAPIEAAVTGMHARFSDLDVRKKDHEATISGDMLQFWLRDEPIGDRMYEFTLSFLKKDAKRWANLATEKGVEHFNIEFHPSALWREIGLILSNDDYVARHSAEGIEQLVGDLEGLLGLARQALDRKQAASKPA